MDISLELWVLILRIINGQDRLGAHLQKQTVVHILHQAVHSLMEHTTVVFTQEFMVITISMELTGSMSITSGLMKRITEEFILIILINTQWLMEM